jgi:asparagine synthase (glutamine-hydrolysing)
MSAIGGRYCFSGSAIDEQTLCILERGLASRGPDGGATVLLDSIALIFKAFHTNRESVSEQQPLTVASGESLAWDGRLDNRVELLDRCRDELVRLKSAELVPATSVERFTSQEHKFQPERELDLATTGDTLLVLAAFKKWGDKFCKYLVGDYALSLWDSSSRSLYLARDPFGMRPLYYSLSHSQIIWSSQIQPLVRLLGCSRLDEHYMAGFLTVTEHAGRTPYREIASVVPGQMIAVRGNQVHVSTFWPSGSEKSIVYKSDGQYEEHFRHLFTESVACRLRVNGVVMAELSGGMDSSSVVCVADKVLGSNSAQAIGVETISLLYDGSPTCDERPFIRAVEEKRGKKGNHLYDYSILGNLPDGPSGAIPNPQQLFPASYDQLFRLMREHGARVLLSGYAGDQVLMNDPTILPSLSEALSKWKLPKALGLFRAFAEFGPDPYLQVLWKGLIWPQLPLSLKIRWAPGYLSMPDWLNKDLIRRTRCHERKIFRPESQRFRGAGRQYRYTLVAKATSVISSGYYRDRGCVELSCPFLDRPLIEFLLSIPSDQLVRPGDTRSLLRRSLRGILPEEIRLRKDKRGPDEAIYNAIKREWPKLTMMFEEAHLYKHGYVDRKVFREMLQRARYGFARHSQSVLRAIALEVWLRTHAL